MRNFPDGFLWGAATASYQIEGALDADGKGRSIWDVFCRKPGAVWGGHRGDVACDHYHRYHDDIALMQEIGLQAYRFSISWPRVLPDGIGSVNTAGLDFYDHLVDALLAAGITPCVTLFHWDYPYALHCRGGWLNPDCGDWFAEYTRVIMERLSDRVAWWMPYNEPHCFLYAGLSSGELAPGLMYDRATLLRAIHNAHLAHGNSVQAIRAYAKQPARVGLATVSNVRFPVTDDPRDIEAARRDMFNVPQDGALWHNSWWLDPIYLGRYPEDGLEIYKHDLPPIGSGDMEVIHQPLDFFGMNVYSAVPVRMGADGNPETVPTPVGFPLTAIRWEVRPEAMYWGPRYYQERYGLPIIITENGMSGNEWPSLDGQVHDPQRIDFLQRYLRELGRACADGVDVLGYFHWSLLDNFEWAQGFKERFGLVYIDYPTQQRILKDSARWYGQVIRTNGAML